MHLIEPHRIPPSRPGSCIYMASCVFIPEGQDTGISARVEAIFDAVQCAMRPAPEGAPRVRCRVSCRRRAAPLTGSVPVFTGAVLFLGTVYLIYLSRDSLDRHHSGDSLDGQLRERGNEPVIDVR